MTTPFQFLDRHGLPFAVVMARLQQDGLAVAMPQFVSEARSAGWSDHKIRAVVLEAVAELAGPAAANDSGYALSVLMGEDA